MKLRSRDGRWTVELVSAASGSWLRVREYGYYAAQVRKPVLMRMMDDIERVGMCS